MAGSPDPRPGEEWDDVQEELASAAREACSFGFDLSSGDLRAPRAIFEGAGQHRHPWALHPRVPRE